MGRPTRAARMSEWVLHCEVKQRHIRRSQLTRDAALKDACSQLLQGYSVNRIVGPNETITAERIKNLVRLARVPAGTSMAPTRFTSGALVTRNNFAMHSTEGSRDPAPVAGPQGDTLGRGSRFGEMMCRSQ